MVVDGKKEYADPGWSAWETVAATDTLTTKSPVKSLTRLTLRGLLFATNRECS